MVQEEFKIMYSQDENRTFNENAPTKISIRHLSKSYDAQKKRLLFSKNVKAENVFYNNENSYVLRDVNLDIKEGEFHIFLGASGCGKSTLLNIIAGFLDKTEGEVLLKDHPITKPGPDRGVVFQNADQAIFPWLTVEKNVEYGLRLQGVPKDKRAETVARCIELVGLTGHEKKHPSELSGGMKQRVQIARSIACDPEILIMDEPFGALDAQTRSTLQDEIVDIWRKTGKTILFVTHDLQEAVYLGERISIFSASPNAKIVREVVVPFGYPRDPGRQDISDFTKEVHSDLEYAINAHKAEQL